MASYADGDDLLARADANVIADLCQDSGVRPARDELAANPIVLVALADASGKVDVSIRRGGRYTSDDVTGLSGNSLAHLKRVVCTIAMSYLFRRRPGLYSDLAKSFQEESTAYVEALSDGHDIFDVDDAQAAAHPKFSGPLLVHQSHLNQLLPDRAARYYPVARPYRWPLNQQ